MKRTIRLWGLITSLLVVLSVAGWSGGNKPATSTGGSGSAGPEKVHFYNWTNEANMEPLLEAFNKEYAGKYEMVYDKLPDSRTMTINTALASGQPVDIMTQANAFDLGQRADSGAYMGLKQFFDRENTTYGEVFGNSIEQTQNINGDYYSLPYCKNITVVYFNKRMFDEAGIPYPDPNWTWADFRETAKKFTKGSGADKVYGAMVEVAYNKEGHMHWSAIASQRLGAFWFYNPDFKSTRFDDPAVKESLQFFYDLMMVDKSIMPMEEYVALNLSGDTDGMIGLYSGRYAMFVVPVYGSNYLKEIYGKIPEGTDIGMTNLPRPVGAARSISTMYTSTASIFANTKNKEGAWTALKYICIDHAELFAGPKIMHPGYEFKTEAEANAYNNLLFKDRPGLDYDMTMRVMALPRDLVTKDNTVVQGQAKINDLVKANMSLVFNGEMTVDAALKDLKVKGDQYIAEDLK